MAIQYDKTQLAEKTTDEAYDLPIDFWDDPEELNALVVYVTHRMLKTCYVDDMLYVTCIDELLQAGWEALLSAKAADPLMRKGRVIRRMKRVLKGYMFRHVLNLTQVWICPEGSTSRTQGKWVKQCFSAWEMAGDEATEPTSYSMAEVLDRTMDQEAEQLIYCSRNPEAVLIAREDAAERVAESAAEQPIASTFLFHQLGDGLDVPDLYDGDHPEMEEALFVLLCAMHYKTMPGRRLNRGTKRRYASILVKRMRGESNVTIAAEQGRKRMQVGSDVGKAKQGLKLWYSLSRAEQVEALQTLYEAQADLA